MGKFKTPPLRYACGKPAFVPHVPISSTSTPHVAVIPSHLLLFCYFPTPSRFRSSTAPVDSTRFAPTRPVYKSNQLPRLSRIRLLPLPQESGREISNMAQEQGTISSIRKWIVDHKLRTVGCLWLGGIGSSIAYNWSQPNMKTSVKLIHARLHAQALTLAALAGAAAVEYYDRRSNPETKVDKFTSQYLAHTHKD